MHQFQDGRINNRMTAEPKETLQQLLETLCFQATIEEHQFEDGLLLEVKTEDSGRLIGRQGQTLTDLQYLLNRLLFQKDQSTPKVMVDVGGYRAQAREALVKKAKEAADKVRRWGDVVELEPLSAFDRDLIAIANDRNGSTDKGFGCDMTDDKTMAAAGKSPICDKSDIFAQAFSHNCRSGGKHFAHARTAFGPFKANHEHVALFY